MAGIRLASVLESESDERFAEEPTWVAESDGRQGMILLVFLMRCTTSARDNRGRGRGGHRGIVKLKSRGIVSSMSENLR